MNRRGGAHKKKKTENFRNLEREVGSFKGAMDASPVTNRNLASATTYVGLPDPSNGSSSTK